MCCVSTDGTMATTLGVLNPLRYRGYVYDAETGLYYLNSRYYDAEVGRFISPDSADVVTITEGIYDYYYEDFGYFYSYGGRTW